MTANLKLALAIGIHKIYVFTLIPMKIPFRDKSTKEAGLRIGRNAVRSKK